MDEMADKAQTEPRPRGVVAVRFSKAEFGAVVRAARRRAMPPATWMRTALVDLAREDHRRTTATPVTREARP